MQGFLSHKLRFHFNRSAPQGLQKAVVRALELRHVEVLRHLVSRPKSAEFASVLAMLPERQRADALSLLKPEQQKRFDEMQKQRAERKAEWKEFKDWKAQQAPKAQ